MSNLLLSGTPRSGKSTAIQRVVDRLRGRGWTVGGVRAPARRRDGRRVGFDLVDVATGERVALASRDASSGPRVGAYRVDVAAVDRLAGAALPRARREADLVVIDEIAPMELFSRRFVEEARRTLAAPVPTLAAVHRRRTGGLVPEVLRRGDATVVRVTPATRDGLVGSLLGRLERELSSRRAAGRRPRDG